MCNTFLKRVPKVCILFFPNSNPPKHETRINNEAGQQCLMSRNLENMESILDGAGRCMIRQQHRPTRTKKPETEGGGGVTLTRGEGDG